MEWAKTLWYLGNDCTQYLKYLFSMDLSQSWTGVAICIGVIQRYDDNMAEQGRMLLRNTNMPAFEKLLCSLNTMTCQQVDASETLFTLHKRTMQTRVSSSV